jgi:hypothetical protein
MERIWKDLVVAKLQILFRDLPRGTEQITKDLSAVSRCQGRDPEQMSAEVTFLSMERHTSVDTGPSVRCGSYIFSYWNSNIVVLRIVKSVSVRWKLSFGLQI